MCWHDNNHFTHDVVRTPGWKGLTTQLPKTGTGVIQGAPGKTLVRSGTGAKVATVGANWSAPERCTFSSGAAATQVVVGAGLTRETAEGANDMPCGGGT